MNQIPKKNTVLNYTYILSKFSADYGHESLCSITQDDILSFLSGINKDTAHNTKLHRFRILSSFFNFTISSYNLGCDNPCQTPLVRKMFKGEQLIQWNILDKDIVDEIVSKVILRHSNLATTQRYLGKVSDIEAMRWIEQLHG